MKKLQNKRGASAVLAMVVFLIATLFSFAIVNSALTAMHTANARAQDEQAYLTASSAARAVQAAIEAKGASVTITRRDDAPEGDPPIVAYQGGGNEAVFSALVDLASAKETSGDLTRTVKLSAGFPGSDEPYASAQARLEDVNAKLTLSATQGDYALTVQLVTADGGARVTLVFRGQAATAPLMEGDGSGNEKEAGKVTTVRWSLDTVR